MAPFKDVFGGVGSIDKEVETLVRMHDALEAKDEGYALELLALVGKVYGDDTVIQALKKVSKALGEFRASGQATDLMTASSLLSIARKFEVCPKTRTRLGYVSDFMELLGLPAVERDERGKYKDALQEPLLLEDAHEIVLESLKGMVRADEEPLDMLKLLVGDYASLDAWASYTLVDTLCEELEAVQMTDSMNLKEYYYKTTAKFLRTLWNMERRGFFIDLPATHALRIPMGKDIDKLERTLVRMAGWDVNPPLQTRSAESTPI